MSEDSKRNFTVATLERSWIGGTWLAELGRLVQFVLMASGADVLLQVSGASEAHLTNRTSKRTLEVVDVFVQPQTGFFAEGFVTNRTDVHSAIVDCWLFI